MFKKIWQISALIVFISFLAVLQFSLISAWPEPFRYINLGVLLVTFALFFFNLRPALFLAMGFGLWLDFLSFHFLGFYIAPLVCLALADAWLANNWLTNRSLYSFIVLVLINTLAYNLFIATLARLAAPSTKFFLIAGDFWSALMYQALWSLAAAFLLFHIIAFLTKRIKPFFLEKKPVL